MSVNRPGSSTRVGRSPRVPGFTASSWLDIFAAYSAESEKASHVQEVLMSNLWSSVLLTEQVLLYAFRYIYVSQS